MIDDESVEDLPSVDDFDPSKISDNPVETPPVVVETSQAQSVEETVNPAWEPLLSALPKDIHNVVKPHLKTWDDNYNNLQTKYKPYEPYLEQDPRVLEAGLTVLDQIQNNPKQLYENLVEYMKQQGVWEELQQPQQSQQLPEEDLANDPWKVEFEKRQAALDERAAQLDAYVQQQVYEREVQSIESDIKAQVDAVMAKYPNAVDKEDLVGRLGVQLQMGQPFNAEKAYQDQRATFQRLYEQQYKGRPSPQIIPTTGTPAPSLEVKPEDMDEEQRMDYFKHLLDIANNSG